MANHPAWHALLRQRFLALTRRVIAGELDVWSADANTAMAFPGDPQALSLFARFCDARTADFARRHHDVIARFGRFPHRNTALGRVSRAQKLVFQQTPGSRF